MSSTILTSIGIWPLVLISAGLYLIYTLLYTLYSAYLGPLSKIPGPRLRALSNIPNVITMMTGTEPYTLPDLHATYGPIVRIGPKEVSYAGGAEHFKAIYGFKSEVTNSKSRDFYLGHLNKVPSIFEAGREGHGRMRKILTHSFADKTLRSVEPRLKGWVGGLLRRFGECEGRPVDVVGL